METPQLVHPAIFLAARSRKHSPPPSVAVKEGSWRRRRVPHRATHDGYTSPALRGHRIASGTY